MFVRPANRIYRKSQMGLWFGRVACDWEKAFRAEEILYGRKLYKEGAIRTVELSENEAIICAKLSDASEPYCVLDFEGDRYVRRGSSDNFQNAALSVAGFYEIEELVADVFSSDEFIDYDASDYSEPAPDGGADGGQPDAGGAAENGESEVESKSDSK